MNILEKIINVFKKNTENKKNDKQKWENIPVIISAVLFSMVFIGIIINLSWYVEKESHEAINNEYNPRDDLLAEQNVRGSIIAEDGSVLAYTEVSGTFEKRVYPYGSMFAHVVGYSTNGAMGIEELANMSLLQSNAPVTDKVNNDINGVKDTGDTVITTLNPSIQEVAYRSLSGYKGAVIVTEVETGKVLAWVSLPDFDPNYIESEWEDIISDADSSVLLNRVSQGQYPPGSTFKIIDALEYYRENDGETDSYHYNCSGSIRYGERKITCYHGTSHGSVDMVRSFAKSCNCSFANIGLSLDRGAFSETLTELMFGTEIPSPFAYKKSSIAVTSDVDDSELVQASIGQGTTLMSPLHLNMITAAIANDGVLMTPMVISGIENVNGNSVKKYEPENYGRLMSSGEAEYLTELMTAVVETGTGDFLKEAEYTSAGKTGSAEYGTQKGDSHAWFTGFAPAEEPKVAVTIIIEGAGSGGDYAVPVAKRIFDAYFEQFPESLENYSENS